MYLKYGSHQHADNECSVVISRNATRVESGVARETLERWDIAGQLNAADAASLTTLIQTLESAYADNNQDVGLYEDDGTPTAHRILNRDTIDGVFVVQPPSYPEGEGAEYATYRNYTIAIEAKTTSQTSNLLSWMQAINYSGNGGPNWGWLTPLVGPPQQQMFTQRSLVTVYQEGQAVGWNAYPTAPTPIYSQYLHGPSRTIRQERPSIDSNERRISWSYVMLLPTSPI